MSHTIHKLLAVALVAATFGLAWLAIHPAQAHEDRPVGPYTLHVGWHVEPALLDQLNAVELMVTTTTDGKPVTGVEKTLTVTVSTRGQTSNTLNFDPSDESPGLYTAAIIPTATGDYQPKSMKCSIQPKVRLIQSSRSMTLNSPANRPQTPICRKRSMTSKPRSPR